ncbi:MAG TPA: helix-turn-helix transcriptional regulator [Streptosporangiaceae bacterium]|nr:helix-turn-helix transcriptional regulator [Streptosporangiaceae bacterium]
MSPVFRHGSLRLYLLRLLDEEPRHGYEVIRLLRDRFMGVYSPSPGTIYPRLARLEEEGLVTHDEVDGRKVYRITEAGREELRSRSDELDELEEELSASVSDIVREVREDVRQTVRSLREELTFAARESRRASKDAAADVLDQARQTQEQAGQAGKDGREQARQATQDAREQARRIRDEVRDQVRQARDQAREHARRAREDAREQGWRSGGQDPGSEGAQRVHEQARRLHEEAAGARFGPGEQDSDAPPGAAGWSGWTDWPGRRSWEDWSRTRGRHGWGEAIDFGTFRDLERLAVQFTADLRKMAMQSSSAGENVITDLRTILEEALERIKSEIFGSPHEAPVPTPGSDAPADAPDQPSQERPERG